MPPQPTSPAPPFLREEKEIHTDRAQEISRKPLPPKHATKPTLIQPSQRLSADSEQKLTPSPLSVASFPKMSSPEKDRVTDDGHLRTDATTDDAPAELTAVVDDLLNGLSTKFSAVSAEIFAKMDDMSRRLDSLEAAIQAGNETDQAN
ncbi:MAG: hypothetical protein FRX48_07742 [Lasallia pustulata]|uniref:Heat shock factor binding 1 n=1 Tax=Lasallia pustulata TaxID=136370 RepID=A0A5M8PIB8_9LECA|nr:MAG: hypothetical protein FRX48_07742 [Lasallia pustulata]